MIPERPTLKPLWPLYQRAPHNLLLKFSSKLRNLPLIWQGGGPKHSKNTTAFSNWSREKQTHRSGACRVIYSVIYSYSLDDTYEPLSASVVLQPRHLQLLATHPHTGRHSQRWAPILHFCGLVLLKCSMSFLCLKACRT